MSIKAIPLGWVGKAANLNIPENGRDSLVLFQMAQDDPFYIPAVSFEINGSANLIALRDALLKAYPL
jgi:hypothetical protein